MAGSNLDHLRIQAQPSTPSPRSLKPTLISIYLCLRIFFSFCVFVNLFMIIKFPLPFTGQALEEILSCSSQLDMSNIISHCQVTIPCLIFHFSIMQFELLYPQICECYLTKSNKRQWIIVCSHIYSSSWRSPFWQSVCVTCCGSINSIFITSR